MNYKEQILLPLLMALLCAGIIWWGYKTMANAITENFEFNQVEELQQRADELEKLTDRIDFLAEYAPNAMCAELPAKRVGIRFHPAFTCLTPEGLWIENLPTQMTDSIYHHYVQPARDSLLAEAVEKGWRLR